MVMAPTQALPHLKWDVVRYHEAARLGVLGDHRLELLDGDLIVVPSPDPFHEWLIRQIIDLLVKALGDAALVEKTRPVALSETSEPVPDIVVLTPQPHEYKYQHPQPDDVHLLIEIANSNSERDTKVKRSLYAKAGIAEYWVFDLVKQELRVFRDIQVEGDAADYATDIVWSTNTIQIGAFPEIEFSATELKHLAFD